MPLDTISGTGRTANREAGVTLASLAPFEIEKAEVEKAESEEVRCGGRPSAKSSAPEGCGQTSASFSATKTKGRPWAAEVETTAEDIDSSGRFQGTPGFGSPGGVFAFYSPMKILRLSSGIVKLRLASLSIPTGPCLDCLPWQPSPV
jgi:hypothetical protein